MRVLVIGSGGREHALAWKIAQSKLADKVFCAPGNAGIAQNAECIDIPADDITRLLDFVKSEKIDFTIVGPEAPLDKGIVDEFNKYGLNIFGPVKEAARLEASKAFAKELMRESGVPTADFKIFDDAERAIAYLENQKYPLVIKADGLAAGKGVVIAENKEQAKETVHSIMKDKIFGHAGNRVIIEDCLIGEEASILVFTDSRQIIPLASSQDHKRVFDADKGPNTGGMGAYSPAPIVTKAVFAEVLEKIIQRIIQGLARRGVIYKGVLYAGVMLTQDGPKALEFNVRFGDPETQAILPRLKTDLLEVMLATANAKLSRYKNLDWDSRSCVCVVVASGGYPGDYQKGKVINGLDEAGKMKDIAVFHAGTKKEQDKIVTSGGRVLGVSGLGDNIKQAIEKTYQAVEKIDFEGMHYRKDIGYRAVR
ncbi:MAG: phosphoribosylamine--glycine ligase [Candidatus Omnitrophica bacterium]|nr:phosphoribosylamine--glycine ligase [Candidatus Omnitrophota bacterium]MDD5610906.1 phosphoribosylamine--glycine ligase [Candidatus Omnitrophota bacterium]